MNTCPLCGVKGSHLATCDPDYRIKFPAAWSLCEPCNLGYRQCTNTDFKKRQASYEDSYFVNYEGPEKPYTLGLGAKKDASRQITEYYCEWRGRGKEVKLAPGERLLEVGCAEGLMLAAFRDLGWQALGIDVSKYAVKKTQENGCFAMRYDLNGNGQAFPDLGSFDCVVFWDSLEHLFNPVQALRFLSDFLKTGALLVAHLPVAKDGNPRSACKLDHEIAPTRESLAKIFEVSGYIVKKVHDSVPVFGEKDNVVIWAAKS